MRATAATGKIVNLLCDYSAFDGRTFFPYIFCIHLLAQELHSRSAYIKIAIYSSRRRVCMPIEKFANLIDHSIFDCTTRVFSISSGDVEYICSTTPKKLLEIKACQTIFTLKEKKVPDDESSNLLLQKNT